MKKETFVLRHGEVKEFVDDTGVKHTISVSRFADHDHEHKPIYHPLDGDEDENLLVVTAESDVGALSSSYPPIYASCVPARWEALRGSVAFQFEYHEDDGGYVSCTVQPNKFFGVKVSVPGSSEEKRTLLGKHGDVPWQPEEEEKS